MNYERVRRRLLAMAFVGGPMLMLASAVALISGIGRSSGATGYGSPLEGLIGFFGFVVMVPVFVTLADRLGHHKPRLAAVAVVTALVGFAGGGVMQMTMRVMSGEFARLGVAETVFEQTQTDLEAGRSLLIVLIAMGPLVPITSILLGIGFLLAKRIQLQAWLLTFAGVSFLSGQLLLVATDVTYTLALFLWAVALVPMGYRALREDGDAGATSALTGSASVA